MGIYLPNMEIPKTGCYILSVDNTGNDKTIFTIAEQTHSGKIIPRYVCEAILVPPHGRLIDAAELQMDIHEHHYVLVDEKKRRYNLRLMWIADFDKWLNREPPMWRVFAWRRWKHERPVWMEQEG